MFAQRSRIKQSLTQREDANVIPFGYEIYRETDEMTISLEQSQRLEQRGGSDTEEPS